MGVVWSPGFVVFQESSTFVCSVCNIRLFLHLPDLASESRVLLFSAWWIPFPVKAEVHHDKSSWLALRAAPEFKSCPMLVILSLRAEYLLQEEKSNFSRSLISTGWGQLLKFLNYKVQLWGKKICICIEKTSYYNSQHGTVLKAQQEAWHRKSPTVTFAHANERVGQD